MLDAMKRFLLASLLCTLSLHAQSSSGPSGTVEGSVVCSDGNVPARGATIQLVPISELMPSSKELGTPARRIESSADFEGRFVMTRVPEGTYVIEPRKDGYDDDLELVRLVLGKLTAEQQNEVLSSFPQVSVHPASDSDRNLVLHRAGSISGRVLADDGGTLAPTYVNAVLVSSPLLGNLSDTPNFVRRGLTDDRGVFRIAGLPAGNYRLSVRLSEAYIDVTVAGKSDVSMRPSRVGTAELEIFSPDSLTQTKAKQVSVGKGADVSDIDITLPLSKLYSVGGKLIGPGQKPVSGAFVSLRQQGKRQ